MASDSNPHSTLMFTRDWKQDPSLRRRPARGMRSRSPGVVWTARSIPLERCRCARLQRDRNEQIQREAHRGFSSEQGNRDTGTLRGGQILLLHTIGAKTGQERISPLAYILDGEDIVIIASKGGSPENPAWYHNLLAHPTTTVELGEETFEVTATALTEGPERQRLYDEMAAKYTNFTEYQKNTDRLIPVVVLRRT